MNVFTFIILMLKYYISQGNGEFVLCQQQWQRLMALGRKPSMDEGMVVGEDELD